MDSFFGIGIAELFFVAIIALIVLGPERLPGAMREVVKYLRYFRNLSSELTSQFSEEIKMLDDINPQKIMQELVDDPADDSKEAKDATKAVKPAKKATPKASAAKTSTTKASTTKTSTTKASTAKASSTKPSSTATTSSTAAKQPTASTSSTPNKTTEQEPQDATEPASTPDDDTEPVAQPAEASASTSSPAVETAVAQPDPTATGTAATEDDSAEPSTTEPAQPMADTVATDAKADAAAVEPSPLAKSEIDEDKSIHPVETSEQTQKSASPPLVVSQEGDTPDAKQPDVDDSDVDDSDVDDSEVNQSTDDLLPADEAPATDAGTHRKTESAAFAADTRSEDIDAENTGATISDAGSSTPADSAMPPTPESTGEINAHTNPVRPSSGSNAVDSAAEQDEDKVENTILPPERRQKQEPADATADTAADPPTGESESADDKAENADVRPPIVERSTTVSGPVSVNGKRADAEE